MAEQDDNVTVTYTEHPVYAALNEFLHSHFTKRNVADTLSCLSDQLYSIGTGEHELATTKASFSHLLEAEFFSDVQPHPLSNLRLCPKGARSRLLGLPVPDTGADFPSNW